MSEQQPTTVDRFGRKAVECDGIFSSWAGVDEVYATHHENIGNTYLRFGRGEVGLLPEAWVQVIPLLIEALPEPARSQAIAAVAQLDAEVVPA